MDILDEGNEKKVFNKHESLPQNFTLSKMAGNFPRPSKNS